MPHLHPNFVPIDWEQASPEVLLARIAEAGIVGMGGAGFPTAKKIASVREHPPSVVIANGVETDPDVNADKELLTQHLSEILTGTRIVARILAAKHCYLAVSDEGIANRTQAYLKERETVKYLRPTYQNGAERELIEILTGHVVKDDRYPTSDGYVVLNVHTLFAIAKAVVLGTPLTKRLVTVNKTTRWLEIGTPVDTILESDQPIRIGSYATGYRPRENEVLTAPVNAITIDKSAHALPCIKCGWCDHACPLDLPVETLYLIAQQQEPNVAAQHPLDLCNDCGACVVACPSDIHLLDHLRALRQRNANEQERKSRADKARARVASREHRLRASATEADATRTQRMQQQHKWQ